MKPYNVFTLALWIENAYTSSIGAVISWIQPEDLPKPLI
jgi:hypothetical protein